MVDTADRERVMRQYPLRMPLFLFDIAERLKTEEGRSLNEQLVQLIREAYMARGELPSPTRQRRKA